MNTYFEHRSRRTDGSDLGAWMLALIALLVFWGKIVIVAEALHR